MLLVGPIFAQIVTLSVADRTEGRYVATYDKHYEAATQPLAGVQVGFKHLTLSLRYAPMLTVLPLESKDRDLLVFHNAVASVDYSFERWKLTLTQGMGYGDQNFYVQALTDPRLNTATPNMPGTSTPTGPATPTGPTTGGTGVTPPVGVGPSGATATVPRASAQTVRYQTWVSSAALQRQVSQRTTLRGELGYVVSGAVHSEDERLYPLISGPRATGSAAYQADRSNSFATTVMLQYASSSYRDPTNSDAPRASAYILTANEVWGYKLDRRTTTLLGAGLSGSRSPAANGFIAWSIFPIFTAGITRVSNLAHGNFTTNFIVNTSPAIDLVTSAVDPRLSLNGVASYAIDRFSASVGSYSAISLAAQSELGALTVVGGTAGVGYRVGEAVSVDGGARLAYQRFQGQTVLPLSHIFFVGVTFGLEQRL